MTPRRSPPQIRGAPSISCASGGVQSQDLADELEALGCEADIIRWRDYNELHFIQCACRLTERCASCGGTEQGSKRAQVKQLIRRIAAEDPVVEKNIFRSVENVNLNTVIAYKKDGVKHHFLDAYDGAERPGPGQPRPA